jgi:hypothetical protein
LIELGCDSCEFREDCHIRKLYNESEKHYQAGNIEELRRISNILDLHESHIVEMRRNVNSRLVELYKKNR